MYIIRNFQLYVVMVWETLKQPFNAMHATGPIKVVCGPGTSVSKLFIITMQASGGIPLVNTSADRIKWFTNDAP